MDQSQEPIEVEVKPGVDLLAAAARFLFSFVIAILAYVVVNDHVSATMGVRAFMAVMVIGLFWPKIVAVQRKLSPEWRMLLIQGIPFIGIAAAFIYSFPSQTWHITLKIAWAILRARA